MTSRMTRRQFVGRLTAASLLLSAGLPRLASAAGLSLDEIYALTHIDRWFLDQIAELIEIEAQIKSGGLGALDAKRMFAIKRKGFSDARVATLVGTLPRIPW